MKKLLFLLPIFIFIVSVFIGFRAGSFFALRQRTPIEADPPTTQEKRYSAQPTLKSPAALLNGQRCVLGIVVDDLNSAQPKLQSAWMFSYFLDDPEITLSPVYPFGPKIDPVADKALANAFHLYREKGVTRLDSLFLEAIQTRKLCWSGYFVIDDTLLNLISQLSYSNDPDLPRNSPTQEIVKTMESLPSAKTDPKSALTSQALYYRELCRAVSSLPTGIDVAGLVTHSPGHSLTNIEQDRLVLEFQALLDFGGKLTCKFPTLSIQSFYVK